MQQTATLQQDMFRKRLPVVIIGMIVFSLILLWQLASIQWLSPEVLAYMQNQRDLNYTQKVLLAAARGLVYDRNGELMAVNTLEYEIGISPNLVVDAREAAHQLATLLSLDELDTFTKVASNVPWISLARPVTAEIAQQVTQVDISGVTI